MNNYSSRNLIPQVTELLLPLMTTIKERELWLTQAFYYTEPRLYYQIEREGAPLNFVTHCIKVLMNFNCFPDHNHALSVLLDAVRLAYGDDKRQQIDALILLCNELCDREPLHTPLELPLALPPAAPHVQTVDTPIAQRTPTVFVSYSRTDTEFVQRLIRDLQANGHAVWIDTSSIKSDEVWSQAISAGINNSYAFVTVVSKAANASRWVQREYHWADQKRTKPIVVVQIEDCELPIYMIERQATRLFPENNYKGGLQKLLAALPQPTLDPVPGEPVVKPAEAKAAPSQRALELAYLDSLRLEEWLKTIRQVEQYTPLAGRAQVSHTANPLARIQTRFKHLASLTAETPQERVQERREYTDILQAIRDLHRVVLLGEPGAGKSTSLWRLAKELFDAAITDPAAPIPLLVRLNKWTTPDQPLPAFIRAELGGLGEHFENLLRSKRAVLLLDGLNEIPLAQRKAGKDEQVKVLFEANPDLISVVSCRERDYTLDLGFDRIEIAPLDPTHVREFVGRYLGEERGEDLFWRIAGGEEVRRMWGKWQQAGALFELFWAAPDVPKENPDVFHSTTDRDDNTWRSKVKNPTGSLMSLAHNPYMLTMMTGLYRDTGTLPENRGELFGQFVEELLRREQEKAAGHEAELSRTLGRLAYEMLTRRETTPNSEEASAAVSLPLAQVTPAFLSDELLSLAGSASLLSVGGDSVRFTHQLLQEYFAATHMLAEILAGRLKAVDLWQPDRWWQPTGWEEATILLAGLFSEDCTFVLDWVAEANPEVAAQCIQRSGATTPPATLERLRAAWLSRLTDLEHDPQPQARAAVGRALAVANLDSRPGVGLRSDGLPDLVWCDVPAGEFIYQEKQRFKLPAFRISKYPITYQQYQAFLDAPDGFREDRWWQGLAERQTEPGEQYFKFWNHPRDDVSWYDAMAFCRWLSAKLGQTITLPTEEQWEAAARGKEGQIYPYGNTFEASKGNTTETGIGQTSAVGIFPNGVSPCGAMDMSGNVWEWTLTEFNSRSNADLSNSKPRVVRGGAWNLGPVDARAACRYGRDPAIRFSYRLGFRVVVVVPSE